MLRTAIVVALISACVGCTAAAQSKPRPAAGQIDGVISDTSLAPIADATITIVGTDIRVVTGANGRFRLVDVPAGRYVLLARRIGYEATTTPILVADLDTLRISIALEQVVASLDTVRVATHNVSPRLAEFYDRRKVGPGQFRTQDEIEKQNPVSLGDVFRRFLGIRMTSDGRGAQSMRDFAKGCPIIAIVDGFVKYTDFSQLPSPKEVAAIEFYAGPSEIPLQFKSMIGDPLKGVTGVSCGLILVWTRDGSSAATKPKPEN
jgi:hypothetical protein